MERRDHPLLVGGELGGIHREHRIHDPLGARRLDIGEGCRILRVERPDDGARSVGGQMQLRMGQQAHACSLAMWPRLIRMGNDLDQALVRSTSGAKRATWRPTRHNCSITAESVAPPASSNLVIWVLIAAANGVGQPRSAWTIERSAAILLPVACQPNAVAISPTGMSARKGRASFDASSSRSRAFLTTPERLP